jgi:hypothetical protein
METKSLIDKSGKKNKREKLVPKFSYNIQAKIMTRLL